MLMTYEERVEALLECWVLATALEREALAALEVLGAAGVAAEDAGFPGSSETELADLATLDGALVAARASLREARTVVDRYRVEVPRAHALGFADGGLACPCGAWYGGPDAGRDWLDHLRAVQ